MCAKVHHSRLFFIGISCYQLSVAVDRWWQLPRKKIKLNLHPQPKGDICAKFQLSRLIFIVISCHHLSSVVISCQQLLTAVTQKYWNEIFIYTPKVICVPKFSSLGRVSFSSAVISCYQPSTALDSCHEKNLNGIFIYPPQVIWVPNFGSPGLFSLLSAVISCQQLLKTDDSWWKWKST